MNIGVKIIFLAFKKIKKLLFNFKNFFGGKIKNHPGLTFSLLVYFLLVFWKFFRQGIINFDEAYFVVVARTFSTIIKTALFNPPLLFSSDFFTSLAVGYGNVYTAARPSYIFLSSLLGVVFPYEYSTRLLSVFSGAAAVIFFYRLLGLYNFNKHLRTVGTILLTLSPLFLLYSRLGLSQIFSAAFLVVSLFYLIRFYKNGIKKDLIKFSLSWSILFMSHYNVLILCFFLLLYGAWAVWKRGNSLKNWLTYITYLAALPLLWEIITRLGVFVSGNSLPDGQKIMSYSQEFLKQLTVSSNSGFLPFTQPWYYFSLLWQSESLIFIIIIFGFFVVLKNLKKFQYQAAFVPFLFSFLFFIYGGWKFPRNLISILPVFYLLAFFGFNYILLFLENKIKYKNLLFIILAILIIPHIQQYYKYLNINSGAKEAAEYIKNNYNSKETIIVSWSSPIWRAYLPGYMVERIVDSDYWRKELQKKPRLVVIKDHFTEILDKNGNYDIGGKKEVAKFDNNIFSVCPVIMDFIFTDKKSLEKLLFENQTSEIVVYEYGR